MLISYCLAATPNDAAYVTSAPRMVHSPISVVLHRLKQIFIEPKKKDLSQATRTVAYAMTPLWLSNLAAIPTMMVVAHNGIHWLTDARVAGVWLAALIVGSGYFIYMMIQALPKTMQCNEGKKIPYAMAVIFLSMVVSAIIGLAGTKVLYAI